MEQFLKARPKGPPKTGQVNQGNQGTAITLPGVTHRRQVVPVRDTSKDTSRTKEPNFGVDGEPVILPAVKVAGESSQSHNRSANASFFLFCAVRGHFDGFGRPCEILNFPKWTYEVFTEWVGFEIDYITANSVSAIQKVMSQPWVPDCMIELKRIAHFIEDVKNDYTAVGTTEKHIDGALAVLRNDLKAPVGLSKLNQMKIADNFKEMLLQISINEAGPFAAVRKELKKRKIAQLARVGRSAVKRSEFMDTETLHRFLVVMLQNGGLTKLH